MTKLLSPTDGEELPNLECHASLRNPYPKFVLASEV